MIYGILQLANGLIMLMSSVGGEIVLVPAPPPPAIKAPAPGAGACEGGEYPNVAGRCPEDMDEIKLTDEIKPGLRCTITLYAYPDPGDPDFTNVAWQIDDLSVTSQSGPPFRLRKALVLEGAIVTAQARDRLGLVKDLRPWTVRCPEVVER